MIEIGIKWQHKDGGVYEVIDYREQAFKSKNGFTDNAFCVWYRDKDGGVYVRTEKHFLTSFKPYEPVYEWRWAYQDAQDCPRIATRHHTTYEEAHEDIVGHPNILQRLDFTKRERK